MRREGLKKAIALAHANKRLGVWQLRGMPCGGWPETQQARWQVREALPPEYGRTYTLSEFIAAIYDIDEKSQRYVAKRVSV